MTIREELFSLQDVSYGDFQAKLTPGVQRKLFTGVRVPEIRKLAKKLIKEPEAAEFLRELPHKCYDENMLHGLLVSEFKEYDACIKAMDTFLPYVNNWAVCDIMSPNVFNKNRSVLMAKIKEWSASEKTYTCRFGIKMLMSYFLDEDFKPGYLDLAASVHSEEYYVRMMIAWFFATALAKQWNSAIPYIENGVLDAWLHNKAIQKACESYRITLVQKEYLKTLKR